MPVQRLTPAAAHVRIAGAARVACLAAAAVVVALLASCTGDGQPTRTADADPALSAGAPAAAPGAVSPVVASRPWHWETVDGVEVDTRNWTIRTSLRSGTFTASLPSFYEAALVNFREGLVPLPPPRKRLEAYIFGTRDDWAKYAQYKLGADAAPYLKMGRGGFTTAGEAVLYDIGPRDTLAIAAHEGWHQYSQTTMKSALPVWLEEGIACFMEGFRMPPNASAPTFLPWRNPERYAELRNAARRDRLATLRQILEGSPQSFLEVSRDAQLAYYAQVWALLHFMREGEGGRYRPALAKLLDDAVAGRVADRVRSCDAIADPKVREVCARSRVGPGLVLAYFNPNFEEFAAQYDAFVGALLESNAWDRVMRGESPLTPAP